MTSVMKFYVISGGDDESPPCYLLQIDEFKFLLDCGWDERFNMDLINKLKMYINQIDAVLISHPDHLHLGALPYLVGKCGLNCPVYTTVPVYQMGQMFMYDLHQALNNVEEFNLFSLDDIDAAFDKVVQVKYHQMISLKGKGFGLRITALPAGHTVGGTIWKISKVGEDDIIYAVDFNHKKERHLNGSQIVRLEKPSLLILDCFNGTYSHSTRRLRDEKLLSCIITTLRAKGNVLIAIDTAGRVLELMYMLDQFWQNEESDLSRYSLVFLTNVSYNTVEFAKSQIEWMNDKLMKSFEDTRSNPFCLKNVKLCHSMNDLNRVSEPMVVLASNADLESGFSREVFIMWASNAKNSIILTDRTASGTLARDLIEEGGDRFIKLTVKKKVPLEGKELNEYIKLKTEIMEAEKKDQESSEEDEEENQEFMKGEQDLVLDGSLGAKLSKNEVFPVFPYYDIKRKFDVYGEIINREDYVKFDIKCEEEEKIPKKIKKIENNETDPLDVPSKYLIYGKIIYVAAKIETIDFEGRSDADSIKQIVYAIKPRRLVLVKGSYKSTKAVSSFFKVFLDGKVYSPRVGKCINMTTESHIYQIHLTNTLLSKINLIKSPVGDIAYINGKLKLKDDGKENAMEVENVTAKKIARIGESPFTLEHLKDDEIPSRKTLFINHLKLSDFKQILTKNYVPCELSNGVLWCYNRTICVHKNSDGKVFIEGVISRHYYFIRDLLYSQFIMI